MLRCLLSSNDGSFFKSVRYSIVIGQILSEICRLNRQPAHKVREIGWLIMDPSRCNWPPLGLRSLTNEKLLGRVHQLFVDALPKCNLPEELEADFKDSFESTVTVLHQLRRDRNRILHSAFIELKAGGEAQGLLRSNPKIQVDEETGEPLFDQELLTPESFSKEMTLMGDVAVFLNRAYLQPIARYPDGGAC